MFNLVKVVLYFLVFNGIFYFVTSSLCGVTICRRQQRDSSFIKCDMGRILFENVTGIDRTFSSLRRICTGKKSCDIYRICQDPRNQNIRVSYTCNILPPTEPLETCTSDIMVLNQEHGVILSPRYPDIVIVSCSWRIAVPRDHFAVITVHDLERQVDNCNGGLQIRARKNCPNNSIPPGLICKLKKHSIVYRACGDVDVDLVTNMISGLRFWISYQVFPMFKTPHLEYKAQYSCPEGTETKQEVKREPVMPPVVETEQIVEQIQVIPPIIITRTVSIFNTTIHFDNETAIDKIGTKQTTGINSAERMIFYVAIAVAFLSLNGLIVVTVICIRRQRRLKVNGPIIDHSAIPSTYHASFNCNRPLPPVANQHSQLTNSPSLMDGYGVVADDIAQGCNDQISQSSAYAEVDDTLPYRPQPYRYSLEKPKAQESIENVYSELTDNDKSGYWEIADTVWHNTPYSQTDNDKLIKREKWRKSHCSNHSVKSRPSSFEGPFSHFAGKRKSELSENTDSDDSLFGNDQYDYIQSVHV